MQNVKVGYLEHEVFAVEVLIIFSRSSAYGAKLHIPNFTCDKKQVVKRILLREITWMRILLERSNADKRFLSLKFILFKTD